MKRLSHDVDVEGKEREKERERRGKSNLQQKGIKKLRVAAASRWPGDFTEGKVIPFATLTGFAEARLRLYGLSFIITNSI